MQDTIFGTEPHHVYGLDTQKGDARDIGLGRDPQPGEVSAQAGSNLQKDVRHTAGGIDRLAPESASNSVSLVVSMANSTV